MQSLMQSASGGPWATTMSFATTTAPFVDDRRGTSEAAEDSFGDAHLDREGD
jgi:hypothetical protein